MIEPMLLAVSARMILKFLGFAVFGVAVLAWFFSWLKDKMY